MSRSIVTAASIAAAPRPRGAPAGISVPTPVADGYSDALLKLIPVEVIGLYLSMSAMAGPSMETVANAAPATETIIQIVIFLIGALLTYFYLKVYLKVSSTLQVLISVGAFCVWALAINSSGPDPWIPGRFTGMLVLLYTFVAPKIPIDTKPDEEK